MAGIGLVAGGNGINVCTDPDRFISLQSLLLKCGIATDTGAQWSSPELHHWSWLRSLLDFKQRNSEPGTLKCPIPTSGVTVTSFQMCIDIKLMGCGVSGG